jgi:3'-5' exoribonuclease
VNDADQADGFDPLHFVDHSRFDPEAMFVELCTLAEENIADEPLRLLVRTILDRSATPLKQAPATTGRFFPFAGGLLEHTLSVTHSCLFLADKYAEHYPDLRPPLNRDLVVAGAILHDIGRTLELSDGVLNVQPTVPGRLLGHLFLGRDLVRDTAREIEKLNPELLQLLEHILITHLALPEWGSPRLPLIPECLILHHADDLDAKLEMYARCLTKDKEKGPFTARDPSLGRQLYKGRSV